MRAVPTLASTLLGAALLAACAAGSPADFDRRMGTYVSGSEAQLVSALGVPHQVYEVEGRRFLQYDFSRAASSPSISPSIGFGFGGAGVPAEPCAVTFEVRDGRVLNFERQGEGCR